MDKSHVTRARLAATGSEMIKGVRCNLWLLVLEETSQQKSEQTSEPRTA